MLIENIYWISVSLFVLSIVAVAASFFRRLLKNSRVHFKPAFDLAEKELFNYNFSSSFGINATEMDKNLDDYGEEIADTSKKVISVTLCKSVTDRPRAMTLTENKNKIIIAGNDYKQPSEKDSHLFNIDELAGGIAHISYSITKDEKPICILTNPDDNVDFPIYVNFYRVKKGEEYVLTSNSIIKINKNVFKVLIESSEPY